jgi:hypothetical protein
VVVTRTKDPSLSLSLSPGAFVTATTPVVHPKQLRVPVRPSHFPPPLLHQRRPTAKHTERLSFYYYDYYHLRGIKYTRPTRERTGHTRTQKLCFPSPLPRRAGPLHHRQHGEGPTRKEEPTNQVYKKKKKKKTGIQMKDTINSKPKVLANSETPTRRSRDERESLVDDKLLSKDNEYNTGSTNV